MFVAGTREFDGLMPAGDKVREGEGIEGGLCDYLPK
jgi:hypothetical protein